MTPINKTLVIGLDGYEHSFGKTLIAQGKMPALAALIGDGMSLPLDHGRARETGLGWEHFSTGLDPSSAARWAAVDFDQETYGIGQHPTGLAPFTSTLDLKSIAFDVPYFDLRKAGRSEGLVGWGAHDPGIAPFSKPASLAAEIERRFGPYPADEWIYGFTWPSPDRTRTAAAGLEAAVELRAEVSEWLLAERLPGWDLGIVVISEFHSAIEPFWHGIDPQHPLHSLPSAAPSRDGLERIYSAGDRLIGRMRARFPEARIAVVSMHGMGPNTADLPSMALLPELLYRRQFGKPRLTPIPGETGQSGIPLLPEGGSWEMTLRRALMPPLSRLKMRLGTKLRRLLGNNAGSDLDWMPAALYRRFWPRMEAFALPAYYDGRIRINLQGRERAGLVPAARYGNLRRDLAAMLEQCRDPVTGERVVDHVDLPDRSFTDARGGADLCIAWRAGTTGLVHPELGTIGPLPYRRTGGHTGVEGFAALAGPGIGRGSLPRTSAFDIVPTVIALSGHAVPAGLSGRSFADALLRETAAAPALDPAL